MNYVYLVYVQNVEYAIVEIFKKAFSTIEKAMEYVKSKYSVELDVKAIEKGHIKPEFIGEHTRVYIRKIKVE